LTSKKKILIAPLNWGLGHAARCIPVINALLKHNFEPILASDGAALQLLTKEFPVLKFYDLPSYKISYSHGKNLKLKLIQDIPAIVKTVKEEKKRTTQIHELENLSGIISDNRFGVRHPKIPSVYITHQINVLSGNTTFLTSKIHQYFISKFDECWIPDNEDENNLSGKLSEKNATIESKFIGPLSRLQKKEVEKKYDSLVLLSGPEPQRSILEKRLLEELLTYNKKVLFVRGVFTDEVITSPNKNIILKNYLLSEELETAINGSEIVLARSGYSTIMDLAKLEKKAFFIPTPGQYEQIYLAERMQNLKIAPFATQQDFKIEMLSNTDNYKGFVGFKQRNMPKSSLFDLFNGK
jgi:uncharacterized protein (TIGR00661 family)